MNTCKNNFGCFDCEPKCGKCGPAAYDCDFSISAVPFDPTTWNVSWCGKLHRVKVPTLPETDTTLSIDYSNATLNYAAEAHTDILTGTQLGSIINVGDLRDTKVDYDTTSMCYELIYHKYGDCGKGCKSPENSWSTFSIDNAGALGPQIRYVRAANRYGCPYFLDVPSNPNQWWFQGWRGATSENGYYQPKPVDSLPTDSKGDPYVLSQDMTTKQPLVGTVPLQCMFSNLMGNLGVNIKGVWTARQGTTGFGATFDQMSGDFDITWNDWNDFAETQRAGVGHIKGKMNWDVSADIKTGALTYTIHSVDYNTMTWTKELGVPGPTSPKLSFSAISMPDGQETQLFNDLVYGNSDVSYTINRSFSANQTIVVQPGQTLGPFKFAKIYVDWVLDDDGDLGVQFSSNLSGWNEC